MDYYCAHEWIDIREDTLDYINKLHENAFKHFLQEIGLKDTFAYKYDYETSKRKLQCRICRNSWQIYNV